ncbi:MAG: hypothetical protein R2706_06710 [Acidimicrobiales bacterium]
MSVSSPSRSTTALHTTSAPKLSRTPLRQAEWLDEPVPVALGIDTPTTGRSNNIVFQVLLGVAACLALVAVVQQATGSAPVDPTSVDAPPPAVFLQAD